MSGSFVSRSLTPAPSPHPSADIGERHTVQNPGGRVADFSHRQTDAAGLLVETVCTPLVGGLAHARNERQRPSARGTDPWGNNVEVVGYEDVQFTKAPEILRGMGLDDLEKTEQAREELRAKGLG